MTQTRRRAHVPATLDFEARFATDETDEGTFSGYASVWGQPDAFGDVIQKGAFARTLAEHRRAGTVPGLFWSHNPAEPIGRWTSLSEDETGLKVDGRLVLETRRGQEAHALLKAGALNGLSIGFRARQSKRGPNGGRVITDLELVEISLVSLPAAARARISDVRAAVPSRSAFLQACTEAARAIDQRFARS